MYKALNPRGIISIGIVWTSILLLIVISVSLLYWYGSNDEGRIKTFRGKIWGIQKPADTCTYYVLEGNKISIRASCNSTYQGTVDQRIREGDEVEVRATVGPLVGSDSERFRFYDLKDSSTFIRKLQ